MDTAVAAANIRLLYGSYADNGRRWWANYAHELATLTLDDAVVVEGNLVPDSTISITICVGHDGTIVVVNIIVIQVIVHDLPPGDEHDDDGDSGGNGRVTICHKGNTLTISQSGLNGHLGHGDTVGACRQGDDDDHDDDHDDDDDDD